VDIVKWDASVSNFQCSSAPYDDILSKAEIIDYDIFGDPNRANLNIWGQGPQGQNHAFDDLFYLSLWATNPTYAAFVGTFSTTSGLTTTSRGLSPAQAISPVGTIGSVRIGYGDFNGFDGYSYPTIIGEYQIINSAIPEPSVYAALAALAVLGFTVTRRFRS
jgi:hypothetical protein